MSDVIVAPPAYESPAVRKITSEQAQLLLLGEASIGKEAAKEMLKICFYPDPPTE